MRPAVGALILLFVKKADIKNEGYISGIYSFHRRALVTADARDKQSAEIFSEEEIFLALFCGLLILIAVAAMEVKASKMKTNKLVFSSCTKSNSSSQTRGKENLRLTNKDISPSNKAIFTAKQGRAKVKLLSEIDTTKVAVPVLEGNVSQVYKLFNVESETVSIFKPYNLEKNIMDKLALSSKRHCINEVTAFKLDQLFENRFRANVPETRHVQLPPSLFFCEDSKGVVKGSLQKFLNAAEVSENYGSSMFVLQDVLNVGLLDLKILNCDRHQGNLLFRPEQKKLLPIDHALSFPELEFDLDLSASPYLTGDMTDEVMYLRHVSYDWLMFPQAKQNFPREYLAVIRNINIEQQLNLMKKLGYNIKQRLACYCSLRILKIGALDHNKTLFDIGSLVQRQGSRGKPSVLEELVDATLKEINKSKLVSEDSMEVLLFTKLFNEKVQEFFRL